MTTSLNKNKTVTVILPNYNYGKYITSRIDDILSQTHPVSELIILDDASTDNSMEMIKESFFKIKRTRPDLKVKIIANKKNSGNVFSQWQKGIEHATSDYIWIAELDDVAMPKLLSVAIKAFEEESVRLSVVDSRFIDEKNRPILKDNLRKVKDMLRRNILVYNTIPNVSAAVFKNQPSLVDFLEEAKKFHLSGDWFFYVKISETGKIAYNKKILNLHRLHSGSVTKTTDYKLRFTEMHAIHTYIIKNKLADEKTKDQIIKLEKTLKKRWSRSAKI